MTSVWDKSLNRPVTSKGEAVIAGHLRSEAQVSRWQAAGFDIHAALDRLLAFEAALEALMAEEEAAGSESERKSAHLVFAFYEDEEKRLIEAGLADDPDFWRIKSAPKAYWAVCPVF